jgi:hypothetical protein
LLLVWFCFLGCGFYGESWKYEESLQVKIWVVFFCGGGGGGGGDDGWRNVLVVCWVFERRKEEWVVDLMVFWVGRESLVSLLFSQSVFLPSCF